MYSSQNEKAYLPSCWKDDTRMSMLFSEFRCQTVNPDGWNDKMNFWINAITDYCLQTKSLVINHVNLCETFRRDDSYPNCLRSVLDHMLGLGTIVKLADFSRNSKRDGWLDWGLDVLLYSPISWSLSYVMSALQWNRQEDKYVMINIVKELAFEVCRRHHESADSQWMDNVISIEDLEQKCSDICVGMNLQLCLIYLQKINEVVLLEEHGQQIVKFKGKDDLVVEPISEIDRGSLRLQKTKKLVTNEIEKLELNIKSCIEDAKHCMKNEMKAKAMAYMKKKRRLEKLLQKKISSLDNIEHLHDQLQDSCSNKRVLDAYSIGVSAMKAAVKDDLNMDKIYSTMADVEEMIDTVSDVQEALSNPVNSGELDLSSFEMELDELLSERKDIGVHSQKRIQTTGFESDEEGICKALEELPIPDNDILSIPAKKTDRMSNPQPLLLHFSEF